MKIDARVKQASLDYTPEATWSEGTQEPIESAPATESAQVTDPTVANAGMTELEDASLTAQVNDSTPAPSQAADTVPAQTIVTNGANETAEAAWDPPASAPQATEQWANAAEVPEKTPEAVTSTQQGERPLFKYANSWADDNPAAAHPATNEGASRGDGFERVHHVRQNSGRGRGFRNRGPRGDGHGHRGRGGHFRGGDRGERGDFRGRGRGRGEFRGGRGRGSFQGGEAAPAQA